MHEYILQPEDSVRVLEDGVLEVFCDRRTMMFFEPRQLSSVGYLEGVPADDGTQRALQFTGADSLFEKQYTLIVPQSHPDYAALCLALKPGEAVQHYQKRSCDHKGGHSH